MKQLTKIISKLHEKQASWRAIFFRVLLYLHKLHQEWLIAYKNSIFYLTSPLRQGFYGILIILGLFWGFNWLFPLPPPPPCSTLIVAKNGEIMHAFLTKDQKWRLATELHEIMPEVKTALLFKEDRYFYYHFGINPWAMLRAWGRNTWYAKRTSGASTITMQVARLLEPKKRTYWHKLVEIFRALQLEWYYSKDEILQLYLNLVPYGSNIEGVKSASLLFFGKMPKQLSLAQTTTLAIVPNRPNSLALGKHNAKILQERNKWLQRFAENKVFPPHLLQQALQEDLVAQRRNAPQDIPHLAYRLQRWYPSKTLIKTHLAADIQTKVQQLSANYLLRVKRKQIHNLSVLVVHNPTRRVVAYIGSADFFDKEHQGEVDGITAIRSPGSTLKSFLYAVALDKGLVTPKAIIADVPTDLHGFAPDNFYKNFSGNVSLEKALAQSLNIPAIKVLEQLGVANFAEALKKANFMQIAKDQKKLGLSMILGGCGVTLEELTNLYASLAQSGSYLPLQYIQTTQAQDKHSDLVSPAAAYLVSEMLSKGTRPDLPTNAENSTNKAKIAWKTGTSYGKRDAWSIGYYAEYTVGVWVGNFRGEGDEGIVGAEVATPLLFDILNSLHYHTPAAWFNPPATLSKRWVCAETGLLPNHFCQNQIQDWYLPMISSSQMCQHLKEVIVSQDEKIAYCLSCLPAQGYKRKMYPNLSPEVVAFYEAQGIAFERIPKHNPTCPRIGDTDAPVITSPSPDKQYIIDRHNPPGILLQCKVHNEVKMVYWYINDIFYQAAKPQEAVFFKPKAGEVKIACTDDQGRTSQIITKILNE